MPSMKIVDFTLTITKAREIHLHSEVLGTSKTCRTDLERNSLREWTIKTSIQSLRDKRLNENEIQLLGAHLYSALLDNDIARILDEHRGRTGEFLRIEIGFEDPKDEVATWPYEYLYRFTSEGGPNYFIANEPRLAIIRKPGNVRSLRPVQVESGETVRVLFVAASVQIQSHDSTFRICRMLLSTAKPAVTVAGDACRLSLNQFQKSVQLNHPNASKH